MKPRQFPPLCLILLPSLVSCSGDDRGAIDPSLVHTVIRGDLVITVRERGELEAQTDTRVTSQLEGRATLIYLIEEGSVVNAGEKVAELDASDIQEKRSKQAIDVAKAQAALEQARKNFEIMEKELLAAERTAESRLQIALMRAEKFTGQKRNLTLASDGSDEVAGPASNGGASHGDDELLQSGTNREMVGKLTELLESETSNDPNAELKYSGMVDKVLGLLKNEGNLDREMGEMANQILQLIDGVSLARADLQVAKDTVVNSRSLAKKFFITQNELERHEIDYRRQLSRVAVSWNDLQLLIKYTLPETLIGLEQEADNARLGLESVKATNDARRVKEAADLEASEAEFGLAKEQLENWDRQIENAVIHAPSGGLVVYGRYDWDEPVYEGMEVRERQEIIILPDVSTMIAEVKVHEAQIDKVALGQTATVKIDAFPGRDFAARVCHVSTLPDLGYRYRDHKVFQVRVVLDVDNSDGTIRPGMNGTVEIGVGTLKDVLTVPTTALVRREDQQYVFRITPEGPVASEVKLGGNNLTHVEILDGAREGDRIHLVKPEGARLPALDAAGNAAGSSGAEKPR